MKTRLGRATDTYFVIIKPFKTKGETFMNLEIANRLVEYRKKAGYSQEELADKLGISRQAVSKWERVEASPDTDNLIALANLYGVSLDELINGRKESAIETIEPEQEVREEPKEIKDCACACNNETTNEQQEKVVDSKGNEINREKESHAANGILYPIFALSFTITYFILGNFTFHPFFSDKALIGWSIWWILFIFIPVIPSFIDAIAKKKFTNFLYPVFITALYCYIGMCYDMWHPGWVLFLTIPLFYIIFDPIDNYNKRRRERTR